MIELKNTLRHYKMGGELIKALDGVNLTVKEGEFVAIMGPSGAGKTTFLNLIGGLDKPSRGQVLVDNEDIAKEKDKKLSKYRNKKIGFVFQSFNLQPFLTAAENVMLPLYFAKVSGGERKKKAAELLKTVGLSERAKHRPAELSAGQRQRVALARALINDPEIILADEPTGNLDSKTGREIMTLLRQLNKQRNVTVVMVTHDPEMARYASRIIRIKDGKVV
ncbi:MAG: ABC transporter ATP-binding protein [Patescibacteria group bacterium]